MKKISLLMLTFTLFILNPSLGMEQRQTEGAVSIAGLLKEDVIRALWVNASGTNDEADASAASAYTLTTSFPCPSREEATQYLGSNTGGYFKGRKVPIVFSDDNTLRSYAYNKNHGPLRAEKVVQAMRNFPNIPIAKLYVSVLDEVNEAEQTIMKELKKQRQIDKMLARFSSFSAIKEADSVGALLASDQGAKQTKEVQEYAKAAAARRMNRDYESTPAPTSAPNPSPAATPKSSPPLPPKQEELSDKFKEDMGPGLRKMFGGQDPKAK